jgi:N-acetylmuramoyl-L-alanine amidase
MALPETPDDPDRTMNIHNDTLDDAIMKPSPNHSGTINPKFIVMHYTAGWTAAGAIRTFESKASQVSAHVTIDTDGTIYQHVPFNVKAWHAGPSSYGGYSGINSYSIGIELVNPGYLVKLDDGRFKDAYGTLHTADEVGGVIASAHPRVGSGMYYWPLYTKAQIEAAEALCAVLIPNYDIIDIVSHEEIDTRGWKTDPGPAFPMNQFKALLKDRSADNIEYEVTASSLNMRGGPGTNFAVLSKLRRGLVVTSHENRGDWVRVSNDGWVHSAYLRRVT